MAHDLERLKQRIPLLEYSQRHNWKPRRAGARQELVGLCPLPQEAHPSFYVNAHKNLFYCHGCGRGGDLIRFVQLFLHPPFRQSVAYLEQELMPDSASQLLEEAVAFYQLQLHRHPEATRYLKRRGLHDPAIIEELGIGYGRPHRTIAFGLRLKQPRRIIQPLSAEQVAKFWASFRAFRDLAMVGFMLLDGLRSCEILTLQLEDLKLADALLHVLGKGKKQRTLPLPGEIMEVLQSYLRLERPLTNSPYLFVSLKGPRRGQPITPAGLRSLFRHHRWRSEVPAANPHRFRHMFGADMVRAGISLPALQQLMGHSQIHTTMLYVQLAPQDVWREYARAVANRARLTSPRMP